MAGKNKYYPELDGVRALAVISILLVHSKIDIFKTLWIGVPFFFTLSGFLITSILLENVQSKNYFKAFYYKRILRIFPIYYLLLLFCIFFGVLTKLNLSQFPYYLFYLQCYTISNNIQPYFCSGLMQHTWSLSVEELFYLMWPFIVFLFHKKKLQYICLSIMLSCIFFKLYNVFFQYSNATEGICFLSFFGNLDCLMAGAIISIYNRKEKIHFIVGKEKKNLLISSLLMFIVISCNYMFFERKQIVSVLKILLSISVVLFSFNLIVFLIQENANLIFGNKILRNKFLLFIGKISYGLYLYHYVIYVFIESFFAHFHLLLNQPILLPIKIIATLLVASLSWYLIEQPILKFKNKINYIRH